jgi:hypothetical protein
MAKNTGIKKSAEGSKSSFTKQAKRKSAASLVFAKNGIRTANDFAGMMGALISDLIEGSVTPQVGNAACKAGSNLLKVVELQHRYGSAPPTLDHKSPKSLQLVS